MNGERERVLRLVRRARRRLEAVRLLKAAAQGALAGGVLGLLSLLVTRTLPWAFLAAGVLAATVAALVRRPIGLAAAALYLDRRLGTSERFTTVATLPPDPLTIRVAEELASQRRLPRSPVPREAALVPLVLFLLFAAGLLPAAPEQAEPAAFAIVPVAASEGAAAVDAATLEKLARGAKLTPREAEAIREAIEREMRRPEERRAARAALDRAVSGEGQAGSEVAEALRPRPADRNRGAALLASAYPEAEEFIRAYRRALEEDRQ